MPHFSAEVLVDEAGLALLRDVLGETRSPAPTLANRFGVTTTFAAAADRPSRATRSVKQAHSKPARKPRPLSAAAALVLA